MVISYCASEHLWFVIGNWNSQRSLHSVFLSIWEFPIRNWNSQLSCHSVLLNIYDLLSEIGIPSGHFIECFREKERERERHRKRETVEHKAHLLRCLHTILFEVRFLWIEHKTQALWMRFLGVINYDDHCSIRLQHRRIHTYPSPPHLPNVPTPSLIIIPLFLFGIHTYPSSPIAQTFRRHHSSSSQCSYWEFTYTQHSLL